MFGDRLDDEALAGHKTRIVEAMADRQPGSGTAVLLDAEFGAEAALKAADQGITCAVAIEESGPRPFALIDEDDPAAPAKKLKADYAKLLVRLNPDDNDYDYRAEIERIAHIDSSIREAGLEHLLEILVPPSAAQLEACGGDQGRFDRELRGSLTTRIINDCAAAGIAPKLWKLEGFDDPEQAGEVGRAMLAARADSGGLVLGRHAPDDEVDRWLEVGAATEGWVGFAIGRGIWEPGLSAFTRGEMELDQVAEHTISRFDRFIEVWKNAT